MGRPRNICFFEVPLPQTLPEEICWLPAFHENSRRLIAYLVERGAESTAYHAAISCLTELRLYLIKEGFQYSYESSARWLKETGPHPKGFKATLLRLSDLYAYGEIQPVNSFPAALPYRKNLKKPWDELLSGFLATLDLSHSAVEQIKNCSARFLYRIQEQGITCPSEISFELLESYCRADGHRSEGASARYTYAIGDILLFMADRGLCLHGLGWYPYFRMHDRIYRISDSSRNQAEKLERLRQESLLFPAEEFAAVIPEFLKEFEAAGYSESPCKTASYVLHNLLLFLEMHGLGYHKGVADVWLAHEKECHKGVSWRQARRILFLFDLYTKEGGLLPQVIFREKLLSCEGLPHWCRKEVDQYLLLKRKEGWAASTINMVRSSVTRFCRFLADAGLCGFSELTPERIKEFNLCDRHNSSEGKNAYNGRIRKFIRHLERKGFVPYGLHLALSGTSATKEKIVVTLTTEEKGVIKEKLSNSATPIELRDKAMMLLGMKMGLRASDIVSIRFKDIDWDEQTLRVLQVKTGHEILLPMPTDVGNAIYFYIKKGRPNEMTASGYIFTKHRVPYDSLTRVACRSALRRTIPDREVPGSGFHVTRKTYATDCLRRGTGKQGVADLLGQRDTQSLRHYLLLDEDRMRMCPLSLSETGLLLDGGRYGTV